MTRTQLHRATTWMAAAALAWPAAPALAGPVHDDPTGYVEPAPDGDIRPAPAPSQSFATVFSDSWITSKVRFRLIRHPGIAPFAINVDSQNSVVTLFGSVGAEVDKREAGRQVMMVSGVEDVRNELQVVSPAAEKQVAKRDEKIRDSLVERLDDRGGLGDEDIEVEVVNGVVRLTGSVDRPGDRTAARSVARATDGVQSVLDELRVRG